MTLRSNFHPADQYLVHASVESSQMMNIYTGNVTLDASGAATVALPDWFEARTAIFVTRSHPLARLRRASIFLRRSKTTVPR